MSAHAAHWRLVAGLLDSHLGALAEVPRWFAKLLARIRHADVSVARMGGLLPAGNAQGIVARRPVHLEAPPVQAGHPRSVRGRAARLEIGGLTYRYPTSGRGISDLGLICEPGTMTVVRGPVGAGRSMLLRAVLGLVTPDAGELRYNGERVADPAAFMIPPRAAYVPQGARLFSESLADNVRLGLDVDAGDLLAAIRLAALDGDLAAMPEGVETLVGPRGVRLSGGQAQRLAAARAMLRDPEVLVLDDLSSALDAGTERVLWQRLTGSQHATLLVVSHRAAALDRADQIITLDEGRRIQ